MKQRPRLLHSAFPENPRIFSLGCSLSPRGSVLVRTGLSPQLRVGEQQSSSEPRSLFEAELHAHYSAVSRQLPGPAQPDSSAGLFLGGALKASAASACFQAVFGAELRAARLQAQRLNLFSWSKKGRFHLTSRCVLFVHRPFSIEQMLLLKASQKKQDHTCCKESCRVGITQTFSAKHKQQCLLLMLDVVAPHPPKQSPNAVHSSLLHQHPGVASLGCYLVWVLVPSAN